MPHDTLPHGRREHDRKACGNAPLQRVGKSEYFAKENRQIARYKEQKERKTVTLNKEKFLAERAELNAEKEQEEIYDDLSDRTGRSIEMDGYGEEALDITVDYLDLLGGNKIAVEPPDGEPAASQPAAVTHKRSGVLCDGRTSLQRSSSRNGFPALLLRHYVSGIRSPS